MVLEQTIPNQQTFWKGYTSLKGKKYQSEKAALLVRYYFEFE